MKGKILVVITFSLLISSCVTIKMRPVYLPSAPQSAVNKNTFVYLGTSGSESTQLYDVSYQKYFPSLNSHFGISAYFANYEEFSGKAISGGIFGFNKFWLKLPNRKYPFANIYIGLQPAFVQYEEKGYFKIDNYYPIALDFGFCPGIYRERFNISAILRGGGGFVIPQGGWFHTGGGLQANVFVTDNISLGGNFEFVIGVGGKGDAALIAFAPILKLNLIAKLK
jgi:hypothetical protein